MNYRLLSVLFFLLISITSFAQKTDVIVLGDSPAGFAAALQAARSGVKTAYIIPDTSYFDYQLSNSSQRTFATGIWQELQDSLKSGNDLHHTIIGIIKKTNNLTVYKQVIPDKIEEKKNGWELTANINGKKEELKCQVLVDASRLPSSSPLHTSNILQLDKNGKFNTIVNFPSKATAPYQNGSKIYRTSAAAGFYSDSTVLHVPLGIFIAKDKENLILLNPAIDRSEKNILFSNFALMLNMGQAAGALAAYGPFFSTTPSKASIRLSQGEMFTYKSIIYPLTDIELNDKAFFPIQKIIATELLKLDFNTGKFHPNEKVNIDDFKTVLIGLYPRSRIWFIENKTIQNFTVSNLISLISFTVGKDAYYLQKEFEGDWKNKYELAFAYDENYIVSKKLFAVAMNNYLEPFNVAVDFNGNFIR